MITYYYPKRVQWSGLIRRPAIGQKQLTATVTEILEDVRQNGDEALIRYAKKFEGASLDNLAVKDREVSEACGQVSPQLKEAIQTACDNIATFHKAQQCPEAVVETTPGVRCWRKSVPIEKVGLYIPGGRAPLFSTILMLGIPARLAGCGKVVLCTPPDKTGGIHPAILYAARLTGIKDIFKAGGAQAIAAMAYGTTTVPAVYKIFGPGNQYVTRAKELVQTQGVAIDLPAGPSEVLVIADKTCRTDFVAADLLSQAEHGPDSQVILLSDSKEVAAQCLAAVEKQLAGLPRQETALQALSNSKTIVLDSLEECVELSNLYAPEHLIIASENADRYADGITNAGSVFLGNYSCESAGDYASGTNHTLPTGGYARCYSGVSLESFVKKITFQELTRTGLANMGKAIRVMAGVEALAAHENAVTIRLKTTNDRLKTTNDDSN